jgi:hypothetical protein
VIHSNQVASISVGLHPKVKEHLASRMERAKKRMATKGKKPHD